MALDRRAFLKAAAVIGTVFSDLAAAAPTPGGDPGSGAGSLAGPGGRLESQAEDTRQYSEFWQWLGNAPTPIAATTRLLIAGLPQGVARACVESIHIGARERIKAGDSGLAYLIDTPHLLMRVTAIPTYDELSDAQRATLSSLVDKIAASARHYIDIKKK